jgi:hypothetical protein
MEKPSLESLERRIVALEKGLAQITEAHSQSGEWKDWRQAVGKFKPTDLSEAVDAAGQRIREADRRKTGS